MSKRKDKNKKENSSKSEKFIPRITKTRYIKNGSPITKKNGDILSNKESHKQTNLKNCILII